jgi:hypothetical protein
MLKTFIKIAASLLGAAAFWAVGSYIAKKTDDSEEGGVIYDKDPHIESDDNSSLNINSNIESSSGNNLPAINNESEFITKLNKVQGVCTKVCSVVQLAVSTINNLSQIFSKENNMLGYTQPYSTNPWEYNSNYLPPGSTVNYIPETKCAILKSPNSPIIKVIPVNNIENRRF